MSNGIQTQVNAAQAPAVAGDFASANPYFSVDAGPGGLVAGPNGCFIGRFAWASGNLDADGFPAQVSNNGAGVPTGFVHRAQQGLITTYLADASMLIAPGYQMALMKGGDFWVKNDGATQALPGQKAYANVADGKATFAATGNPTTGATSSASSIAAGVGSFTGSITDNILTITVVGSGVAVVGGILSGTGVATGTSIVQQLTGTAGGVGTYEVSIGEQAALSTTISETYGILTIGGTITGAFGVGDLLGGTASPAAGTKITALGTGTGGAGTYIVNLTQTVGSGQITALTTIETKWTCFSQGNPGELVKIGNVTNG